MNSKVLSALFFLGLVLAASATSANDQTFYALERIKANEFANDFVGQQIVDTILLQQKSGGSADVIIRVLNGLIVNLNDQQKTHSAQHTKNNRLWRGQLKTWRASVASLTKLINLLSTKILNLEEHIRHTKASIVNNQAQQRAIQQKQADYKAARNVDHQAFLKRNSRQSEMLKAVTYIIAQLELALKSHSFAELNNIKEQLQKLTKENPLQALVELTMTFKPASVQYAIKKLGEIRVGLVASLKDDVDGEALAVKQFNDLNSKFNAFLTKVARTLNKLQARLARQQLTLKDLQVKRSEARSLRKLTRNLIRNTVAIRKAYNQQYKTDSKQRASEVVIVKRVISILQTNYPQLNRAEVLSLNLKKH